MKGSDTFRGMRGAGARWMPGSALAVLLLALTMTGCGNDDGGSNGGATTISVQVNPPATAVQLNQIVQLTATVFGAPNLTIATTNGAVRNNNVTTITTTAAHGFSAGNTVNISGVTDTSFLGTFVIASVPSATTFTFNQIGSNASSGGGTVPHTAVTWQVNDTTGGSAATGTITTNGLYTAPSALPSAVTASITATGAVRSSNVVTLTTTAAHTFTVGQIVSVAGVTPAPAITATITASGAARSNNVVTITTSAAHTYSAGQVVTITGVNDTSFNGSFAITSTPSATTFVYSQIAGDATSGGGTASVSATNFDGTFIIASVPSSTTLTYQQGGTNTTSGGGTVSSAAVQIKAVSVADSTKNGTSSVVLDSGIVLNLTPGTATLATNDTLPFTVTNTGPTATSFTWFVNDVQGGSATTGTISAAGVFTAPVTAPAAGTVTIKVQATVDISKTATALVTITNFTAPTLTSAWPVTVAQGSSFHDFYLVGTNYLTTTGVRFNGTMVTSPTSPATVVSSTLLRVRIPESSFTTAGTFPLEVGAQGSFSAPINVTVTPERPALIGTAPDSVSQGGTTTMQLNGGYYSPSVRVDFNDDLNPGVRAATLTSARQLDVTLSSSDLSVAGLFALGVSHSAAAGLAATNLAVQPTGTPTLAASVPTGGTLPAAVAINPATGVAVVANSGSGTVTLIDLATNAVIGAPILVGGAATSAPTGVAVDYLRNVAVVANGGTSNISIVNLATSAVTDIPSPTISGGPLKPISVAVNSLSGLAIVANQSTNQATILDLASNTVISVATIAGTGLNPQVDVDPRLNWALITPGGSGAVSLIDLGRQSAITSGGAVRASNVVTITTAFNHGIVVGDQVTVTGVGDASFNGFFTVTTVPTTTSFTFAQTAANGSSGGGTVVHPGQMASISLGVNMRGVAVNSETHIALLTDPTSPNLTTFSLIDQTVGNAPAVTGYIAVGASAITNTGIVAASGANTVQLVDMRQPTLIGATFTVGTGPRAVAVDAGLNVAVVANETSGTVSILNLGAIRSPHIIQSSPVATISSGGNLNLTVVGFGLTGGTVRLDGTAVATAGVSNRQLTATVPAAMLAGARRYAVDVQVGSKFSNASALTVIQPVTVGTLPAAVAIDAERNLAIVTNSGSNNISLVDTNTGAVTATITVGTNPQGVAVLSRTGRAVVTNFGSNNASLVDLATNTVTSTVATGSAPLGVAINPNDSQAIVANSSANTLSFFPADTGGTPATGTVDIRPTAIAIDVVRNQALVTHTTSNTVVLVSLPGGAIVNRLTGFQLPNSAVYDPESDRYLVASALGNNLALINPVTMGSQTVRLGINPTSLAHNRHSSTLVSTNNASNTMSVVDYRLQGSRVREVLRITASPLFAVEIHPRTNVAVVVDQNNNRVLLVPLPR